MRTQWGRSAAFTMRSFRFTTTGTSGDNSDQQQRISCDVKMVPTQARSSSWGGTDIGGFSPDCQCDMDDTHANLAYAQMPDCDCHTEEQCEANRSSFSARALCQSNSHGAGDFSDEVKCDNGLNMCHIIEHENEDTVAGVCENCLTLQSAEDCRDRYFLTEAAFDECISICASGQNPNGVMWIMAGFCFNDDSCPDNEYCEMFEYRPNRSGPSLSRGWGACIGEGHSRF